MVVRTLFPKLSKIEWKSILFLHYINKHWIEVNEHVTFIVTSYTNSLSKMTIPQ